MRSLLTLAAAAIALGFVPAASAVGPSPPALEGVAVQGQGVSYVTHLAAGSTTRLTERLARHGTRTVKLPGLWGVALVTYGTGPGGLSPDGHVLVLSDNVNADGRLRSHSSFAVVDTKKLGLVKTIALRGDYSFDALSPAATTLFLIHHLNAHDQTSYQVQAYDLTHDRLLPGVIADKRQAGWIMAGFPVTRATAPGGRWVYTLYRQDDNYPFIHALDTLRKRAVCIGLPASWTTDESWIDSARLRLDGDKLLVEGAGGKVRYTLDTRTLRLTSV